MSARLHFKKNLAPLLETTKQPIAIFDLDGTLFDVGYRTLEILSRFVAQAEVMRDYADEIEKIGRLDPKKDFKYTLEQNLAHVGITHHSAREALFIKNATDFWFKHFFTDELVLADQVYQGAADAVRWFHERGARVVYLSGRDVPNMSRGTIAMLEQGGFPIHEDRVSLILKPDFSMDDLLFKKQAIETIRSEGGVVATFDNEPANVAMFLDEFPEGWHVHFISAFARHMDLRGARFAAIKAWAELGF